jgi:dipeptidyl aminopeptidase/acylaminoacyl peptidase
VDNFNRWIRRDSGRAGLARRILQRHGDPADSPEFWRNVSPRTYFDRITEPILIHHGTSDDSCPIHWSRRTASELEGVGADVTLRVYPGEEHAFGPEWPVAMRRTAEFLRRQLD